ncbi:hypothetical protein E4U54_003347 [Claviceps lovelessii]|nr:hypothetical protein E4U54_003347 [Claviceps lovelessii]
MSMAVTMTLNRHRQQEAAMHHVQAACRRSSSASSASASSTSSVCSCAPPSSSHNQEVSSGPSPTTSASSSSWRFFTSKPHGSPTGMATGANTGSSCEASRRTCQGMSTQDMRELWRCMLQLQRRYGCYNSTRIDLAVNAGDAGLELMPNPFIIDTLNDSLVDLPTQGWAMLNRRLRCRELAPPKATRPWPRFWAHA